MKKNIDNLKKIALKKKNFKIVKVETLRFKMRSSHYYMIFLMSNNLNYRQFFVVIDLVTCTID